MLNDGNVIGHRPVGTRSSVPWSLRAAACYLTIAACLPYLTLKILWLSGSSIGAIDAAGSVVLGGAVAVLALLGRWGTGRILAPLVVAWLGTGVTVTSGPTHVALSHQGNASVHLVTVALAATVAGLLLTASALRVLTLAPSTTHRG